MLSEGTWLSYNKVLILVIEVSNTRIAIMCFYGFDLGMFWSHMYQSVMNDIRLTYKTDVISKYGYNDVFLKFNVLGSDNGEG